MWNNLSIIHSAVENRQPLNLPSYLLWKTCLRDLYIGDFRFPASLPKVSKDFDVYHGYEAYTFLLEIVLGLHSDLLGETEVFHQFRKIMLSTHCSSKKNSNHSVLFQKYLEKLYMDIAVDARSIRKHHMHHLGELSYGGVTRHFLKTSKIQGRRIILFGTGQLASSLLPWLAKDEYSIYVYGRKKEKLEILRKKFAHLPINYKLYSDIEKESFQKRDILVVAAPLSMEPYLKFFLEKEIGVLDFREKQEEKAELFSEYFPLREVLAQIAYSHKKRQEMLWSLKPSLKKIIERRKNSCFQATHDWNNVANT